MVKNRGVFLPQYAVLIAVVLDMRWIRRSDEEDD